MGRTNEADDSWKPFKCKVCGKHFLYSMNCKTHESKHKDCDECVGMELRPVTCPHVKYYCAYCNKTFLDQAAHKRCQAQHKLKPECRYCKKTFRQLYTLKIHMNIHTGRRPYVCNICGYSCHSPQVLRHHELFNHVPKTSVSPLPRVIPTPSPNPPSGDNQICDIVPVILASG